MTTSSMIVLSWLMRPFCEFHAKALPSTFALYHALATDLDLDTMVERNGINHKDRYFCWR